MNKVKLVWVTPDAENLITYIARVSNPKNQQKQLNGEVNSSKLLKYLIENKHWCYDSETEIFTEDGWKLFSAITSSDKVASVFAWDDYGNASFAFEYPEEIYQSDYSGTMILCEGHNSINYCVTPNHNMLVRGVGATKNKGVWKIKTAESCFQSWKQFMKTAKLAQEGIGTFEEGQLRGFLIGDGFSCGENLKIRLKRNRKISYIEKIIKSLGITYKKELKSNDVTEFTLIGLNFKLNKAASKELPTLKDKSSEYLEGLFDGLMNSDGSKQNNSAYIFVTTSENLKVQVANLAVMVGYNCTAISTKPDIENKYKPRYELYLTKKSFSDLREPKKFEKKIEYNGKIYCVTTSSGLLLIRRKNKVFISGNSPFEMVSACFEINTTRAISAQILRHRSFSYQEFSQRYATVDSIKNTFEYPEVRYKGTSNRQSSLTEEESILPWWKKQASKALQKITIDISFKCYDVLVWFGVAPESARMVLPMCAPTRLYMTGTLRSWIHYLQVRNDESHVQKEHVTIAKEINDVLCELFPYTWAALNDL